MSGPWERFQSTEAESGPWAKFQPSVEPAGAGRAIATGAADVVSLGLLDETEALRRASGTAGTWQDYVPFLGAGQALYQKEISKDPKVQKRYEEELAAVRAEKKATEKAHPYATLAGNVGGAVMQAPLAMGTGAATLTGRLVGGAATGAGLGGAYGFGSGEGDFNNRVRSAAVGAGMGAAVGAAVPAAIDVGKGVYQAATRRGDAAAAYSRPTVNRMVDAADRSPEAQARLRELGPQGMLPDSSPEFLGLAQGAAVRPESRAPLVNALTAREGPQGSAASQRVMQGVDEAVGPAPVPSQVVGQLDDSAREIGRGYDTLGGTADPSGAVRLIDEMLAKSPRGGAKAAELQKFRAMLVGPDGSIETGAPLLHGVRQEIDRFIGYEPGGKAAKPHLKPVRRALDETMPPEYKAVDTAYAGVKDAGRAFEYGQTALRQNPADVQAQLAKARAPEQNEFMRLGARADIDRALGTQINDRVALKRTIMSEGDWPRQNLESLYGPDRTKQLASLLDREATFADTHNKVVQNSQTAQRTEGAKAIDAMERSGDSRVPAQTIYGEIKHLGAKGKDALLDALVGQKQKKVAQQLSDALAKQGPEAEALLEALLARRGLRDTARNVNDTLLSNINPQAVAIAEVLRQYPIGQKRR
jgi:hypothetical protein